MLIFLLLTAVMAAQPYTTTIEEAKAKNPVYTAMGRQPPRSATFKISPGEAHFFTAHTDNGPTNIGAKVFFDGDLNIQLLDGEGTTNTASHTENGSGFQFAKWTNAYGGIYFVKITAPSAPVDYSIELHGFVYL